MTVLLAMVTSASWYWPFGGDDDEQEPKRLSELLEPATLLIDEASDLASDGKVSESVEKYRKALAELDRIEDENPERAKTMEFASLRNKRAYVNAAIDSMLLSQVKQNALAVAVSDTTELEKRLAFEKSGKYSQAKEAATQALARGDLAKAEAAVKAMLATNPAGAAALNLKAAIELERGDRQAAERTLNESIVKNPKSYQAYYNLAEIKLGEEGGKNAANRLYRAGRDQGGPVDLELEEALK